MEKLAVEKIIKEGSGRQKIKLYFTDLALFNCRSLSPGANIPARVLTNEERAVIFNSIKERKDIKYWEDVRVNNKAFLMFKPTISTYSKTFDYLTAEISKHVGWALVNRYYEDAINKILEEVEEEELREKLVKKTLENLKEFKAKKYQRKGFLPLIEIPQTDIRKANSLISELNQQIKEAKGFIKGVETFLNKSLPLQPYKKFIKEEEARIKKNIEKAREVIMELKPEEQKFSILYWDKVKVEITDEDLKDIKNAGR